MRSLLFCGFTASLSASEQRADHHRLCVLSLGFPMLMNSPQEFVRALKSQRTTITGKLDTARDQQKNASRVLDAARRKFRFEVLSEADVICSTLSGAGHEVLEPFEFETVIIDEAAQAIEIATLIPLRYGCKTCILVGDPQQLPPTVISQLASGLDYNQSLFVRLQRQNPNSVHLLRLVC